MLKMVINSTNVPKGNVVMIEEAVLGSPPQLLVVVGGRIL